MSSIAVVGAGPGLGMAIARRFGSADRPVALIARNRARIEQSAATLSDAGIPARGYAADVTDAAGLTAALERAAAELGTIGVLYHSPAPTLDHASTDNSDDSDDYADQFAALGFHSAIDATPASVRAQIDFFVSGAMISTAAVLPGMRAAGDGAILFATGASALKPQPELADAAMAQAALRSWAANLHQMLAPEGVYVGHISIATAIIPDSPGTAAIADRYHEMAQAKDAFEDTIGF